MILTFTNYLSLVLLRQAEASLILWSYGNGFIRRCALFGSRWHRVVIHKIERLRNENDDKTKTQMMQSLNQCSENETKNWHQNILNQFNCMSSSCLRSHFVISLITNAVGLGED